MSLNIGIRKIEIENVIISSQQLQWSLSFLWKGTANEVEEKKKCDEEKLPVETTGAHIEGGDHVDGEYDNHLEGHYKDRLLVKTIINLLWTKPALKKQVLTIQKII